MAFSFFFFFFESRTGFVLTEIHLNGLKAYITMPSKDILFLRYSKDKDANRDII